MVKCNKNEINSCRSFKIVASNVGFVSPPAQYYKGKNTNGVAKKFGTTLFKSFKKDKIIILMKETTQGSEKKIYEYELTFKKFDKPVIREIKGKEIINTGQTIVKALEPTDPKVKALYEKL